MSAAVIVCDNCGAKNRVPAAATGIPQCARCHARLGWVADAGDDTFAAVVDAATIPVLVDLWAPWCGPCRAVSPALERLAREFAGRFKLVKVNVDEASAVAQRFEARSIPMLLLFRDGKVVARQIGAAPESALRVWLEPHLAPASETR
jgi:thioredoxin 2